MFNFNKVQFIYFFLYHSCFCCHFEETTASSKSQRFTLMFYSESFIVLAHPFRPLIQFNSCIWCEVGSNVIWSHVLFSCPSTIC